MNKSFVILIVLVAFIGCKSNKNQTGRIPVAKAGNVTLYYDEIPEPIREGLTQADSVAFIQNYINKWAKKVLMYQKAQANLSPELLGEIEKQVEETRMNMEVYEYQRMMIIQKMDTVISREEIETYYGTNEKSLLLTSNIVKALFLKLPAETPNLYRIKQLARSGSQKDMQEFESLCYQFAEKYDDFNEEWISLDRLSLELPDDINDQENFLKRTTYYETADSSSVYLIKIFDYRLRGDLSPYDYVKEDIKRIIWNNRRLEFIESLGNGIYNDALKENSFKIY